ncbi:hypothetical protein ACP70R_017862 [Stipagrostis hirtigluma subsp. patula]
MSYQRVPPNEPYPPPGYSQSQPYPYPPPPDVYPPPPQGHGHGHHGHAPHGVYPPPQGPYPPPPQPPPGYQGYFDEGQRPYYPPPPQPPPPYGGYQQQHHGDEGSCSGFLKGCFGRPLLLLRAGGMLRPLLRWQIPGNGFQDSRIVSSNLEHLGIEIS